MAALKVGGKRYSHKVHEEAFELYCQGVPGYRVAQELAARHGADNAPSRATVRRWAHRHNWWQRREEVRRQAEQSADQRRTDDTARLLSDLGNLRGKILEASAELEFKSAEGAVRSLATLQRVIDGLTQPQGGSLGKEQLEAVVKTIFQMLAQDEVLGPLLAERQAGILARIEAQLADQRSAVSGERKAMSVEQ